MARFNFVTDSEVEKLSTVQPPKTTYFSTKRAVRNFNDWKQQHDEKSPDNKVPENILEEE